ERIDARHGGGKRRDQHRGDEGGPGRGEGCAPVGKRPGADDRDSPCGEGDENRSLETADRLPRQTHEGFGEFERCGKRQQGDASDRRKASHGIVGPDGKRVPRSLPRTPRRGPQGTPAAYGDERIPSNAREGWRRLRWTKDRFETRN